MRQPSNTGKPAARESLAFCGLGFDVERVRCVALGCAARWAGASTAVQGLVSSIPFVAHVGGYELLVALGREIRGR